MNKQETHIFSSTYTFSSYRLRLGDRIKRGDFWEDQYGELHCLDRVNFFEKLTENHCPHYRIGRLTPVKI